MSKNLIKRVMISLLIGLGIGVLINEITFTFVREDSRTPQTIELVIPQGTADLVKQGEQPPSIPAAMTFVAGDILHVSNEDTVAHQLGPVWIPANSQASLTLDAVGRFANECSFEPARYINLDVVAPLTLWTRIQGFILTGVPLGILLAVYSAIAWPVKK